MDPTFDPELFLRLEGERMVLGSGDDERHQAGRRRLFDAASALRAVGAVPAAVAQRIVGEYVEALQLRAGEQYYPYWDEDDDWRRGPASVRPPVALVAPRVTGFGEGTTLEIPAGELTVTSARLSSGDVTLDIVLRTTNSPPVRRSLRSRRALHMMASSGGMGPPSVQIADDRGTTATAAFSGSGGGPWEGELQTYDAGFADDTAWLVIDGARLVLGDPPPPRSVRVEDVEPLPAAEAYLWRKVSDRDDFREGPDVDVLAEVLVAASALRPDDPVVAEVRAVSAALSEGSHIPRKARSTMWGSVPEPWKGMLKRRGLHSRREEIVPVGTVTPVFDGVAVTVGSLQRAAFGFSTDVVVSPGDALRSLTWWARDDRGNNYLGTVDGYGGGDRKMSGSVEYWPALDDRATRVELMPTMTRQRAVIEVPLP